MTTKWTACDTAHNNLTTVLQNSKLPLNEREILFSPVKTLVTKTINYYKSTKASKQAIADAKGLADKIRGFGTRIPKLPDDSNDPAHISNSHQSYVQIADAFKQLRDLYASDPLYNPNEAAIKVTALTTQYNSMKTSNDNIGTIIAPVDVLRQIRNNELYNETTGMLTIAAACKAYVKSVLGATSPAAKLITSIRFKNLVKYK